MPLPLLPGERPSLLVQQEQRLEGVVDHGIHTDTLALEEPQVEDRVVEHQRQIAATERLQSGPELGEGQVADGGVPGYSPHGVAAEAEPPAMVAKP
jgi:hypothetical protein